MIAASAKRIKKKAMAPLGTNLSGSMFENLGLKIKRDPVCPG
jgi:hypothetical protein